MTCSVLMWMVLMFLCILLQNMNFSQWNLTMKVSIIGDEFLAMPIDSNITGEDGSIFSPGLDRNKSAELLLYTLFYGLILIKKRCSVI